MRGKWFVKKIAKSSRLCYEVKFGTLIGFEPVILFIVNNFMIHIPHITFFDILIGFEPLIELLKHYFARLL